MPFPLIKLGYLAIKQASRPLARIIKTRAKNSPFLRNKILVPSAQAYHRWDTKIKMSLLGLKTTDVKPLNDEMALELSSEILGEVVVFSVAVFTIWLEYYRQSVKDAGKEDNQNTRLETLEKEFLDVNLKLEQQTTELRELRRLIYSVKVPDHTVPDQITDSKSGTILTVTKS